MKRWVWIAVTMVALVAGGTAWAGTRPPRPDWPAMCETVKAHPGWAICYGDTEPHYEVSWCPSSRGLFEQVPACTLTRPFTAPSN